MLDEQLNQLYTKSKLRVTNRGICGNTIEGLNLRWEQDVLAAKPDWLFVYVGINDAHVTLNHKNPPTQRLASFSNIYADLISKTKAKLPQTNITLITPFLLGLEPKAKITQLASDYVEAVCELGEQFKLSVINLQNVFEAVDQDHSPGYWSIDGVHPTPPGHQLIADTILNHLT